MRHIASVILSSFLSPFNWIIILVIAGFFFRKPGIRKICRILALCIFIFFSNASILNWFAKKWQPAPVTIPSGKVYSCGIVPGGFASPDTEDHGYFNSTSDRFIEVEKLFKMGSITHILISGGNGKFKEEDFREGAWVKGQLKIMGIPDSVIFVEDRSNNTADNAKYAKQILDSIHLNPPYLLISSAHHIPRASLIFKINGIATDSYPCNYLSGRSGGFGFGSIWPQASTLSDWNMFTKEVAGYYWYRLRSK